jgi:predicted MPP superfamily phosphohydrolase
MSRHRNDLIFAPQRKRRGCSFLLWLLILLAICLGGVLVANDSQNRSVKLEKQSVPVLGLARDLEGFSILHISDLNGARLGEMQSLIAAAIKGVSYKAVCITGNMVGPSGDVQPFLDLLSLLDKSVPILFIPGDSDPAPLYTAAHDSVSALAPYITAAQTAGAVYLDAPYKLTVGKATLWFSPENVFSMSAETLISSCQGQLDTLNAAGSATPDGAAAVRAAEYRLDAAKRLQEARKSMQEGDLHIALSPIPLTYDYVRQLWDWQSGEGVSMQDVTLSLAGHFNGGQWRFPGLGAIYVPGLGFFPDDKQIEGLNRVSTITQYISPGLGSSDMYPYQPGRLFNSPTVTILTLTGRPQ